MRILFVLITLALTAHAGQLDLAVIQFPEVKSAAELEAALANVNLAEITNSNRTMTAESYLKGGYVVFAQSLPSSAQIASSTRLSNSRADVEGRLGADRISLKITLSEGVEAGLRRFTSRSYEANAALSPGQPRVLSIRQVSGRTAAVVKGQSSIKDTNFCTAIIGQISR